VAAVREVLDLDEVLAWYDAAMSELAGTLSAAGAIPNRAAGGLDDNELFTDEPAPWSSTCPSQAPAAAGVVEPFDIRASDLAEPTSQPRWHAR
jgi:hypothetical protein